jgi:2-polyprenyl-3-methyl-5-hydroxy-6-metoxy-1,4-benzoquinol methylase
VDRFGIWLSTRRVKRELGDLSGRAIADFGCGYEARVAGRLAGSARSVTLVDVALADDVKARPATTVIEGQLPNVLAGLDEASFDAILCLSVLEHLWDAELMLSECRRLLKPGGAFFVNVPSWRGKRWLEFSAFRLGLSPPDEMDDHKRYYDPRDLWPMLRAAGFMPHEIRCRRHKFGLNTFARCRVSGLGDGS